MKFCFPLLTILIALLFGCTNNKNESVIKGKISGKIPDKVEYTVPLNGICNWMVTDSVKPDSLGRFQIVFITEKPEFIKLRVSPETQGVVIIEPGKNYDVIFNSNKTKDNFQVFGDNEVAQNQYNRLPNPVHIQLGARAFLKDTVALTIKGKIDSLKAIEIAIFKDLFDNGKISEDFFNLIKTDRDCYYSAVKATTVWIKYLISKSNIKQPFSNEMKALWAETFQQPLLSEEYIIRSPWCYSYSESYIFFKEYMNNDLSQEKIEESRKLNLYKIHHIDDARKYLPNTLLESYMAIYIYLESSQKEYENELITLYNQFNKDYPDSNFTKYLTPLINENIRFHKISESEFSSKIRFIEDYQNKSNLKESVKSLKGNKVFVDVWATWCGPCKAEFSHKEELMKLLESKDIKMLYISIDRDEKEKQWKDMIKFYNLEGYHIRANKEMTANLRKIFDQNGVIAIPWYILIDENGNILKKHALSPSRINELEKQLN
jgi:thiol-disulfide isomerase/thioredoxin